MTEHTDAHNPTTRVFINGRKSGQTHREKESRVTTEADFWVMRLLAKGPGLQATARAQEEATTDSAPEIPEGVCACQLLQSNFWPPALRRNTLLLLWDTYSMGACYSPGKSYIPQTTSSVKGLTSILLWLFWEASRWSPGNKQDKTNWINGSHSPSGSPSAGPLPQALSIPPSSLTFCESAAHSKTFPPRGN